jgi:hypothetical protein
VVIDVAVAILAYALGNDSETSVNATPRDGACSRAVT